MEKITLLGCKPFSINKAYYKRTFTMTKDCRKWRSTIIEALNTKENQDAIDRFRSLFKEGEHGIVIRLQYQMPRAYFYTKEGTISRRSQDISNIEKLLIDIIFDKRFYERGELNNLNIDDKNIVLMHSEKVERDDWNIIVKLEMVNLK